MRAYERVTSRAQGCFVKCEAPLSLQLSRSLPSAMSPDIVGRRSPHPRLIASRARPQKHSTAGWANLERQPARRIVGAL